MICKFCSAELQGSPSRASRLGSKIYCNNTCQQSFQSAIKRQNFLDGVYIGKHLGFQSDSWTRAVLINEYGCKCRSCGIGSEYNERPLTLEVNHIDGDALNNILSNLEFLCPNCHSQTSNFRAKNKVSTRTFRKK